MARDIALHQRTMARTNERAVAGRTEGLIAPGEWVAFEAQVMGIRVRLTSEVSQSGWQPPERFVDEQVAGPFRHFRHEHLFEPAGRGTRMTDSWEHELRWGLAGRIVDRLVVGRLMRRLLRDRADALARIANDRTHGSGRGQRDGSSPPASGSDRV